MPTAQGDVAPCALKRIGMGKSRNAPDIHKAFSSTPGIELTNEVPKELPSQYLDPEQFRQALVNLIQNAVEKVDPNHGAVKTTARI